MIKKYNKNEYESFGLFIIPNRRGVGYKILRDEDGWIFDRTYENEQSAQNWIDEMIGLMNNSRAKWNANTYNT